MTEGLSEAALERIFNVIAKGPFGEHVGLSVDEAEVDRVVVRMKGAPHVMNGMNIVHGGATATLLDTAATCAAWATPAAKPMKKAQASSSSRNHLSDQAVVDWLVHKRWCLTWSP